MSSVLGSLEGPSQLLGAAVGGYLILKLIVSTYKHLLRPGKNLKKFGKWAVVTGATDGIGKAYALALAKKGVSVVLISRTESKLKEVRDEILKKGYTVVEVKYIVCDYSKFDDAAKATIKKELDTLEIGILINNVGMSYRYPVYFHELSDTDVTQLITMNIDSVVWMTRIVLPGMIDRKKGTIVNVSSISCTITLPLLALYGGVKASIEKFSRSINAEYRSKNITCQAQLPFYVATKLAKMRKSFSVPTPDEYVAAAINWIGYADDTVVSPYWNHAIQGWIMKNAPDFIIEKLVMSMHQSIRKRGLKKDAQLATEAANKKD